MININNKSFKIISYTSNGDINPDTVFHYKQFKNQISGTYKGGYVKAGFLDAIIDNNDNWQVKYYHTNLFNELITGNCTCTSSIQSDGKIRLTFEWQRTSKDFTKGKAVFEEIENTSKVGIRKPIPFSFSV